MKRHPVLTRMFMLAGMGILLFARCANTPTVPLPPPEMTTVTAPDSTGYSLVAGTTDVATGEDVAMAFNEELRLGVMAAVEADGAFEMEIEADSGHTIVVQIKRGSLLSREEVLTVPSE
jgi:hypothetical protein